MSESPKSPRSPFRDDRGSPMNSTTDSPADIPAASSAAGTGGSLFVGKLAFDCRPRELEDLFGKYGKITRCDIKRGFAFVEFEDERDASDAIKNLDGTKFLGLNITVERTKGERRASTNPDGSKSRDCFKCGKPGHYARECRTGGGDRYDRGGDRGDRYDRRGGMDRHERRDRYERRDYDRRDRYDRRSRSRSRSRSPGYGRSARDEEPRRRDSRSPKRSPANRY